MNPRGTKICVAGTMSDYATVVNAQDLKRGKLLKRKGGKPYWVTQSWDGRHCYISWSGTDEIAKISYRTGRIVDRARVGDHPQRIRNGFVERRSSRVCPTTSRPTTCSPSRPPPADSPQVRREPASVPRRRRSAGRRS